jgi:hypothetical protein
MRLLERIGERWIMLCGMAYEGFPAVLPLLDYLRKSVASEMSTACPI